MSEHVFLQSSVRNSGRAININLLNESIKRIFDVSVAFVLLIAFLPVLVIIAGAVSLSGQPVLYRHRRVGRYGVDFLCLKFSTMVANGDRVLASHLERDPAARAEWQATQKLRNDPRVTLVGNLLRRTSLDELPQLLNVLRGDMSLVGPRPIVDGEIGHYGERFHYYVSVRPGLTGPWQISGRSDTSYEARVNFDVDYVKNQSLSRDLVILLRTIPAVLTTRGSC